MDKNNKITPKELPSRRKFVLGVAILSAFAAVVAALRIPIASKKNVIACLPESKKKMVKMLTEDGRLVEIDESLITAKRKKISGNELQHWIKKNK